MYSISRTYYDGNTGRIIQTISTNDETIFTLNAPSTSYIDGVFDGETHYIVDRHCD